MPADLNPTMDYVNYPSISGTPIKNTFQGSQQYAATVPEAKVLEIAMAKELQGTWVGPMPVQQFLDTFTPAPTRPTHRKPTSASNWKSFFSINNFTEYNQETDIYKPFIELVAKSGALGKKLKLVDTSHNPDKQRSPGARYCPDITMYSHSVDVTENTLQNDEAELMIEVKARKSPNAALDPFEDNPTRSRSSRARSHAGSVRGSSVISSNIEAGTTSDFLNTTTSLVGSQNESGIMEAPPFEPAGQERAKCRGQLGIYARTVLSRQFRTHFFMVWLGDPYARFIRFDRTGAIVSKRFNYREEGDILLEFFWRFTNLAPKERGNDPSVERATNEEAEFARKVLEPWKPVPRPGKPDIIRPVYKLIVKNRDMERVKPVDGGEAQKDAAVEEDGTPKESLRSQETTEVLVWHPLAEPMSVTGRATRGFPGWDINLKQVVFVKDSWRPVGTNVVKETEILKTLKNNKVSHVPQFLCGDDLQGNFQQTITKHYTDESWNIGGQPGNIQARQHIRFATDKVGERLERASSSRQFLMAIRDALLGHEQALIKCEILHRDISIGNIMIDSQGCGFLNDWDLARSLPDLVSGPRSNGPRSGTWPFMAINLILNKPPGEEPVIHSVQDDLESVLWLTLYSIVRYMDYCNLSAGSIQKVIEDVFQEHSKDNAGRHIGASRKQTFVLAKRLYGNSSDGRFTIPHHPPLQVFIDQFRVAVKELYDYRDSLTIEADPFRILDPKAPPVVIEDACVRQKDTEFEKLKLANYDYIKSLINRVLNSAAWPQDDPPLKDMLHFDMRIGTKRKPVDDDMAEGSASKRTNVLPSSSSSAQVNDEVAQQGPQQGMRRSSRLIAVSAQAKKSGVEQVIRAPIVRKVSKRFKH